MSTFGVVTHMGEGHV